MLNDLNKYWHRFDGHMQELMSGAMIAFVLKITSAAFAFTLNILLVRLLGAEDSGIFFLALTIILMTSMVGRVGMENALIKFVATNNAANKPEKVLGVYQKTMLYSFSVAALLSLLLILLAPWVSIIIFNKQQLMQPLRIMALAIVPLSLFTLHAYALQGLKKITESTTTLSLITPLLACATTLLFVPKHGINAAAWGYLFATTITLIIGRFFWKKSTKSFNIKTCKFDSCELFSCSIPFFGIILMNMIITWSPVLLLGVWESSSNLSLYHVANRTSMLSSYVLIAVSTIAVPKFAELYQQGEMLVLESVAHNAINILVLMATPILILFVFFPEWLLLLFGEEFSKGTTVLIILAVGQFINVSTGLAGHLLIISGHERLMFFNLIGCALLILLLNIILIPNYGILGSAVSATMIILLQNMLALFFVWKKLNIVLLPHLAPRSPQQNLRKYNNGKKK